MSDFDGDLTERQLRDRIQVLESAIKEHHAQKGDDRCWLDDAQLYEAAGLPPHDSRVGDKAEMLTNCVRYLRLRCTEGYWPTYKELLEVIAFCSKCLSGHMIGINCHGPSLNESQVTRLRKVMEVINGGGTGSHAQGQHQDDQGPDIRGAGQVVPGTRGDACQG